MRELVPIVSFVWQRGRCRGCGATIDRMHLEIELAATLVPAVLLAALPIAPTAVIGAGSVLGWGLLALGWIDLRVWRLPDAITWPLAALGLVATGWLEPEALWDHAAACVLAGGGLWALAWTYRRWRGRDGLGMGDVKLLAAGGAWVGLAAMPWVLLAAAVMGLVFALARHGRRTGGTTAVPFGPPLCIAIWVGWIMGAPAN
jgi:leader peptidase (prepilin peptidase)/N-methyltransferase